MEIIRLIVLVLLVLITIGGVVLSEGSDYYYATYEGSTGFVGIYPIRLLVLKSDNLFTLSGPVANEIYHVRWNVSVTGRVTIYPSYPHTWGRIQVENYTFINSHQDAIWGELHQSGDGLVMIGDNQYIYLITNPDIIDLDLIGKRVILAGKMEYVGDFQYHIEILGFNELKYEFKPEDI